MNLRDDGGVSVGEPARRDPREAPVADSPRVPSLANRQEVVRRPPPMTFGAIDVGTNSLHLLMVEISPEGDFHAIGGDKELVQIGRGGFRDHRLTSRKMDEAI